MAKPTTPSSVKILSIIFLGGILYLAANEDARNALIDGNAQALSEHKTYRTSKERIEAIRAANSKLERERKGLHCLVGENGPHYSLEKDVISGLHDPESYEHMTTAITPVDDAGEHDLVMQYRANNAMGGKVISSVTAKVRNDDCAFRIVTG